MTSCARRLKTSDTMRSFGKKAHKADILVAGKNFTAGPGCEEVALSLKEAGFQAVAAKCFTRIFYRGAFNVGLTLIECNTDFIDDGDELELDLDRAKLSNRSKGLLLDIKPLPPAMKTLLQDGGVVAHYRKHGGFAFE